MVSQAAWSLLAMTLLGVWITAVPARIAELSAACLGSPCEAGRLSTLGQSALRELGASVSAYVSYTVVSEALVALAFVGTSALIVWRRPRTPFALFAAVALLFFGLGVSDALAALQTRAPDWGPILRLLNSLGFVSFFVAWYLFPDGRFVPRWARLLPPLWVALEILWDFPRLPQLPQWLDIPLTAGMIGTCLFAQVYRFRSVSSSAQRQQIKWVLFGLTTAVAGFVAYGVLPALIPSLVRPGIREVLFQGAGRALVGVCLALLPITLGIAIWRYRLWDIDLIVNRTLVYAALTGLTIGVYALIAGSLGALLQASGDGFISLVAAGGVAVLFQPLRGWVQGAVNRLMFGERDDPVAVLTRMSRSLEATAAPGEVLADAVGTIAQALRLPFVAIRLGEGMGSSEPAMHGRPTEETSQFPLTYQGEVLGHLAVAPREPGGGLSTADRILLENIARQAGPAIYAMKLTADLQRSRERLVLAREEERRRIRRDLHDGLGPLLASQSLMLDALGKLLPRDPGAVEPMIAQLKDQTRTALLDIRRLINNLRPPTLDELGLRGALREEIDKHRHGRLQISIVADELPSLPAAVEVAIFRIVQEAVTNVVRHAGARSCTIRLRVCDEGQGVGLAAVIEDDGCGLPRERPAGVGLESMRERAEELGGRFRIDGTAGGGTRVRAWVPLGEDG